MLRRVLDGGARDEELSEELRAFVEHDAESKIQSGMTPEDARRAALIELGGAEQVKEHVREARAGARWEGIFRDIRYAMRSLGQSPGFSSSVIGNLSLGLAAMVVAFALINGALLRPFPGVRDQDRLVEIEILENRPIGSIAARIALADYPDVVRVLDEGMPSLDGLASFTESDVAVTLPNRVPSRPPSSRRTISTCSESGQRSDAPLRPGRRLHLRSPSSVARCGCGNSAGTLQ